MADGDEYEYERSLAVEIVEGVESHGVYRFHCFHSNGRLGSSNIAKRFQRLEHRFLILVDRRHDDNKARRHFSVSNEPRNIAILSDIVPYPTVS